MDIKTLFIFISISSVCIAGLSILVYWRHTRLNSGSLYWLSSILAISLSSVFFGLSGIIPFWLNVHLANSTLLICPTFMSLSFRRFYGRGSLAFPLILYVVCFLVFNIPAKSFSVNERIIWFSLIFGLLWLDPIYLTLRKDHRRHTGLLGAAFLAASVMSFLRAGATWTFEKELPSLIQGSILQQVYIVFMGLEPILFLTGYILMLNSRNLERITRNEATLRAAIDNSPYAMITTDPSGTALAVNSTFEKITGYKLAEIQVRGLGLLQSDSPIFSPEISSALLSGHDWQGELSYKRKDGSSFWGTAVWSPIKGENNEVTGFFGVTADITQKRQLEAFKNEIENLMRHDLKTPLNAVINFPAMIKKNPRLSSEQREYLKIIRESGESMLEQINSSLEMYKLEEGTHLPENTETDLQPLLFAFRESLFTLTDERKITLAFSYPSPEQIGLNGSLLLSTDQPLFKRLLGNLLKNAIEASPDNGIVEVSVSLPEHGLLIAIHNAGAIPLEARSRFFAKFNTVGKFNGTGLGAYGAKLIADTLGYDLTFSTDELTGTTLLIRIPSSQVSLRRP